MRQRLTLAAVVLATAASIVGAQSTVDYFNGVPYTWPSAQGDADHVLTNDGAGNLTWADPPSAEGLWSGVIVASLVDCPVSGWTRISAGDGHLLIGSTTVGSVGGAATHTHTLSGILASAGITLSGNLAQTSTGINGSLGTASISHGHAYTGGSQSVGGGEDYSVLSSWSLGSYDPSHSHGLGTLTHGTHYHTNSGLSATAHSHGVEYVASDESNLPAYLDVVLCQRN